MSNNFSSCLKKKLLDKCKGIEPLLLLPNHSIFRCVALPESGCKYTTFFSYQTRIKMLKFLSLFWRTIPALLPKNRRAKILPFSLNKQAFFKVYLLPCFTNHSTNVNRFFISDFGAANIERFSNPTSRFLNYLYLFFKIIKTSILKTSISITHSQPKASWLVFLKSKIALKTQNLRYLKIYSLKYTS